MAADVGIADSPSGLMVALTLSSTSKPTDGETLSNGPQMIEK
jgi:hypothetical protein